MYRSLIIDDEKPVQIAISKLGHFSYYGIESPHYAINGKDGLSAMREFHPDIVFVDMSMPVMDGCTFLQKAHQEFPNSQYIVVSGYDDFSMPSMLFVTVHAIICLSLSMKKILTVLSRRL